jgi:hypothetical protein
MRGIERFFAALLLAGGVAGAAAFAYRTGNAPEQAVPTPLVQPASHGTPPTTVHVVALPPLPGTTGVTLRLQPPAQPAPSPLVVRPLHLPPVASAPTVQPP